MKKQLTTLLFCASALATIAQTTFTLDVIAEGNYGTPNGDVFRRNTTVSPSTTSGGVYQSTNSAGGFDILQDFVVNGNIAIIAEKPFMAGRVTIVSYPSLTEVYTFPTSNAPQTLKFASSTKAYVSMGNPGDLRLIDLTNNTMTSVSDPSNDIGSHTDHMEYANGIIYAALGSSIVKVDTLTNTVIGTITPAIGTIKGLKYEAQGGKLWALNNAGSLVSIDIANGDAIGTIVATGVLSSKLLRTYNGSLYFWSSNKSMFSYNITSPSSLPLTAIYTSSLAGSGFSFGYGRSFDIDQTTGDFAICSAGGFIAPGLYEVVDGTTFTLIESGSIAGCAIPNKCILKTFPSGTPAPIPDIANLPTITAQCAATLTAPTANSAAITGTTSDPTSYATQGTYTVTWTYNNGGPSTTQTQSVIINDITAPVEDQIILDTLWINCDDVITLVPTATDNCAGSVSGTTSDPLVYTTASTNTITWNYTDNNTNVTTQDQIVVVACTQTGINELSAFNFEVYPNPTSGSITIDSKNSLSFSGVITHLNGQIVQTIDQLNSDKIKIDLRKLSNGIYFLKLIDTDGAIFTKKIIIQQ